ncbi:MAG TPA: GNAT family N-acetyltransferase [Saprospiraceae bacterium]|nr:GNAT family N-acetyltransferase [Saprospiraceae bacterium]
MIPIIETDRLLQRPLALTDSSFVIELLNSPGWLRYIGDRKVKTEQQAAEYLNKGPLKSYIEHSFGLSLVERKADGAAVGMCGLIKRDFLEHPDIGFAFLPRFQGMGYAFEMANANLNDATSRLGFDQVQAITLAENANSIRLLEKLGFRWLKVIQYPDTREELQLYHYHKTD